MNFYGSVNGGVYRAVVADGAISIAILQLRPEQIVQKKNSFHDTNRVVRFR